MATLLLSTAGSALGGALLPGGVSFLGATISGAAIGGLVGAGIGSYVDQALFGPGAVNSQGPRLSDLQVLSSTEGTPIPRLYGRARLAGQVIWATKFREHASTTSTGGGKGGGGGGSTITEYSYSVSFAVALCEGAITRIGRVWADGKPLALTDITWRLYKGEEDQTPDALIETVEGSGNAPAYRGIAYIVFEELDLTPFGNRIPQLSFEIFRSLSSVEGLLRGVTIIPGAGEFVYETTPIREILGEASTRGLNNHSSEGTSDWGVALDQLQATCPNVDSASLVVSWFGDDLRCGSCSIRPKVEVGWKLTLPSQWSVSSIDRNAAQVVSQIEGRPAYGGTPSDHSVVAGLRDMQARGLRTVFYPFVMMDIASGNAKPDPYSDAASQPVFPWRGRITCDPAPGRTGTADKTAEAAAQVASFFGSAAPGNFSVSGCTVNYSGPAEWSYRRMVLHYAHLCVAAGGVDVFLIGSELRGLTQLRSDATTYPTVAALRALAADVASILGPGTKISYAADWSEYFGHQPSDGSGDVFFHLDPLWADSHIDFIGIDNYAPLTDWRKTSSHRDADDGARSIYDLDYLRSRIAGGEDFDWYYASDADRDAQIRTPITDGAYGKPWVYRAKDIVSWWSNAHYNRPGGIESGTATAWVPQSKPIFMTETGCPAIDKGTNEPNLFVDPKSSESAWPHYSSGTRDDYMQRRFIEAQMSYWAESGAHNPVSTIYGGPMLDEADIFFWTWDARPYPVFPDRQDIWADGAQWRLGHWLNGRLGAASLGELVRAILVDVGFTDCDVSLLAGSVDGFVIDRIMTPRDALQPLMLARFFDTTESEGVIRFRPLGGAIMTTVTPDELAVADESGAPGYTLTRGQETELPLSAKLTYIDGSLDYRQAAVEARRLTVRSQRVASTSLPMVLTQEDAQRTADVWLQSSWVGREKAKLSLAPSRLALEPGDVVELALPERSVTYRLTALTDKGSRNAEATQSEASLFGPMTAPNREHVSPSVPDYGAPVVEFLDLPLLTGAEMPYAPRVAAASKPWPGGIALYKSAGGGGFTLDKVLTREATMGRTATALAAGVTSRWDWSASLRVTLISGVLSSADELAVLAGVNAGALEMPDGDWEVIQFREAELVAPNTYELRGLLRGQGGTEGVMQATLSEGARFVLLDNAIFEAGLLEGERGLARIWAYGPATKSTDDASYVRETRSFAGIGLRPFSPIHLKAARGTSGDISISWFRRTRIDGDNWEASDVPLGEESEAYVVDIISGGDVARTISASAPSAIYTASAQIADFGSTSFTTLETRVTQLSRAFGRGTAREALLHV